MAKRKSNSINRLLSKLREKRTLLMADQAAGKDAALVWFLPAQYQKAVALDAKSLFKTFAIWEKKAKETEKTFKRVCNQVARVYLDVDMFGFPPINVGLPGELYPETQVRQISELNVETVQRAKTLQEQMECD